MDKKKVIGKIVKINAVTTAAGEMILEDIRKAVE